MVFDMGLMTISYLCLIVVIMGHSGIHVNGECPLPFVSPPTGNSCYYFGFATTRTWNEARVRCLSMDADLLKIDASEEQDLIMNILKKKDNELPGVQEWWVGLKRKEDDIENWVWTDGSLANKSSLRWGTDEPNNYKQNEHCAEIWERTFNDKNCDSKLNFICERANDKPARCSVQDGYSYHNRKCYKFYNNQLNREQALSACVKENARLVTVETEEDQHAVSEIAYHFQADVWMGIKFMNTTSQWLIMNRPNWEEPASAFFWQSTVSSSELNNPVRSCVAMNVSAKGLTNNWYTAECTSTNAFICYKPAGVCSNGFEQHEEKCYLFKGNTRQPWSTAKLFCEKFDSNLLEIESAEEQNFVTKKLQERQIIRQFWIGLKGRNTQTQLQNASLSQTMEDYFWEMSNGTRAVTYLQVGRAGSGSACGYIDPGRSGKWFFDVLCNVPQPFICYHDVKNGNVPPRQFTTSTTPRPTTPMTTTIGLVTIITPAGTTVPITQTPTTIATTTEAVYDPLCGNNWEREHRSQICYLFNPHPSTWSAARSFCQTMGGDLLSINSLQEHYFISGRLKAKSLSTIGMLWTGGHDESDEGGWVWSDGSPFSFFNFRKGGLSGKSGEENCIAMSAPSAWWYDDYCSTLHGSICKKRVMNESSYLPATSPPFPPAGQVYGCPGEEWSGYRLSCFFVARNKTSWSEAQSYCKAAGGDLASILDEGEQAFVHSLLPKTHCYNLHVSDKQCDIWASAGECDKNPLWMANNCQQSCQRCLPDCIDAYGSTECQHWAKMGECLKNHKWMLQNCALSCGICDSAIYGGFWIGFHDKKDEMAFKWSDGMTVTYTTWADRQPDDLGQIGQDCVMMKLTDGRWIDFNCNEKMPGFVCKTSKKLVSKATESPLSVGCSNGSIGYNAFCYGFFETKTSWSDAEETCVNKSGHLATVNDRYVQAFVSSQLVGRKGNFWIGLTQSYDTGITEQWTSGQEVRFTYWADEHTGAREEDGFCVSMSANHPVGLWSTFNCTTLSSFICEFHRVGFTTPSTAPPTTTLPKSCETGWLELDGNCYKIFPPESWMEGRDSCRRMGAELVSIHTDEENEFVFRRFVEYKEKAWIGLNDRDLEQGFTWSDGSPRDYVNWGDDEPNDFYDNEDCVTHQNIWGMKWNDDNCYTLYPYICKIPKGKPVLEVENFTLPEPQPCADSRFTYIHGKCYYFESLNVYQTWFESLNYCNNMSASLVTLTSVYQHDLLFYNLQKKSMSSSFWIGLNNIDQQGWRWADGTSVVSFVAWAQSETLDSSTKRCAYEWPTTKHWYASNCNAKLNSIVCMKQNGSTEVRTTPVTPMQPWGCPPGYVESKVNNKCYKIVQDTTLNFHAASKACSDQGKEYSLVSIHSELENAFIALQLDRKSFVNVWIGFHDDSFDSTFKWLDNSPEDFTNWNTGEPSSYSEHCVEMLIPADVTGKWNDVSCSVSRGYICQTNKALRYPTQAPAVSKCPSGYTATADSCFRVVKTAKDFKDAQSACKVDGANLASINSKYEQMSIEVLAKDVPGAVWIGLKRENESHIWLDNWPYTYVKWALNEPSLNEGEYCTVLLNVEWKDTQCDLKYPAICEYNTGNPPTTPIPGKCPPDSSRFQGFCFYVDPNARVTWSQAKANCINRGMNLLSFRNIKEVEHVRQSVESKVGRYDFPLWIGMRRNRSEDESYEYFDYYPEENLDNKFKWIDEPDNSFKNWNDREPSGSWGHESEECVEMKNTGKFNDINCDNYKKPYGCSGHETFDTPITTAPTAGENPSVVVSTTSSDFEVVSSKQTVSSSIIIGVSRSTTKEQSLKPKEPARVAPKIKLEPDEPNILTAGQIVGILIGTVTLLIIIIVVLLVIKHQLQKGGYVTNSAHGFTNAMYLKTVESVSVAEGTGKQSI